MNRLLRTGLTLFCSLLAMSIHAAPRSSADYTITTDTIDAGGVNAQSANYKLRGSAVGEFGNGTQEIVTATDYTGKIAYVGTCWTSPGIYAIRVFGSKGLMHYEIDFSTWDNPDKLHETSTLYIQRGKDGYGKREELKVPESDMFRAELEMFAESCMSGRANLLNAHNGNIAVAVVYAALKSIDRNGQSVRIAHVVEDARKRLTERKVHFA